MMKPKNGSTLFLVSVLMTSMLMSCEIMKCDNWENYQFPPPFSNIMGQGWGNTDGYRTGSSGSETTATGSETTATGSETKATGSETKATGTNMTNLEKVLENNRNWVAKNTAEDPNYFLKHKPSQSPPYLWIGCSDSRVPPNQILGLPLGELFVLRNVANVASPSDISTLAVIQYTVEVLKVNEILVAGHYGCGGVKASATKFDHGPLEAWLSEIRRIRQKYSEQVSKYSDINDEAKRLVQLNVQEQVMNVASTPFVQRAWKNGQQLRVHGVIYDMETGKLIDQKLTMYKLDQVPRELRVV